MVSPLHAGYSSSAKSMVDKNDTTYGTYGGVSSRTYTALPKESSDNSQDFLAQSAGAKSAFDVTIGREEGNGMTPFAGRVASMIFSAKGNDDESSCSVVSETETVGDFFGTQKFVLPNDTKLGTLPGVFFPCLANIFGVILFLRQPWIIGQAGAIVAETVVIVSVLATTLTALSMSAIATNGQVKAGGTYFMISRTLGPEFGGALGISFYLATTIAIPMYLLGTVETVKEGFGLDLGMGDFDTQFIGLILSGACLFVVYIGVGYVSKAIPFFLCMTMLGILSMWVGLLLGWAEESCASDMSNSTDCIASMWTTNQMSDNTLPDFTKDYDWKYMFGLFFPSVTGITAGANLSACLKNPSRSIPKGTLGAISFSSVVYIMNILLFAMSVGNEKLKDLNAVVASDVAFPHPAVVKIAIVASTLGAALTSFAGAPRLLQAISHDSILSFLNPLKENPEKEPRKTLFFTWFLAVCGIMAGDLNFVTPICTMFFLSFYTFTNFACFLLVVMRSPNFRPDFRTANAYTSALGTLLCLGLMFIINPLVAAGSLVLSGFIYLYISFKGNVPDWGDALFDLRWYTTRKSLLQLDRYGPVHCKNWRPNLLLLTRVSLPSTEEYGEKVDPVLEEPELVTFLSHLRHARGLQVLGTVLEHDMSAGMPCFDLVEARESITNVCHKRKMKCFTHVVADSVGRGISSLLQVAGVGRFQPNIVLTGWPNSYATSQTKRSDFMTTLRMCEVLHKALIVLRSGKNLEGHGCMPYPTQPLPGATIDIWWNPHGGGLLLLIPHILSCHRNWGTTRLRCFSVVDEGVDSEEVEMGVSNLFRQLRLKCESHVVHFGGNFNTYMYPRQSVRDMLVEASAQMRTPGNVTTHNLASKADPLIGKKVQIKNPSDEGEEEEGEEGLYDPPHEEALYYDDPDASARLNELIKDRSSSAAVVLLNLPKINMRRIHSEPSDEIALRYMEGIDILTNGLPATLLIRDGGRDVTTSFS